MRIFIVLLSLLLTLWSSLTFGYGFTKNGSGRADFAADYDLLGEMYPAQLSGGSSVLVYDFGKIGVSGTLPVGLTAAAVDAAIKNAGDRWEPWANITFGDTAGAANTGLVRLNFNNSDDDGYTTGYTAATGYTQMTFGKNADVSGGTTTNWNASNFEWILAHEIGHVLGLKDLYKTYTEEFVDHPVAGNTNPDRNDIGLRDNIMDRNRYAGTDYSLPPQTIVDNDEIAGVTWLWGSKYNQIVTGDLTHSWNSDIGRDTEEHHGDQDNPYEFTEGNWWDYRVSIAPGGSLNPYIRLDFEGLQDFEYIMYGSSSPEITHTDVHADDLHTFVIQEAGWGGNVEFSALSEYSNEKRIDAVLLGGGRVDDFDLSVVVEGRTFDGVDNWAQVFGPTSVPLPAAVWLFGSGLLGLVGVARAKRKINPC